MLAAAPRSPLMRARSASKSSDGRHVGEAHALGRVDQRQRAAGGDHRLRRDAVPQVGGAADDVALDERDLGAEPGRVGGGLVAGRAATDDHEALGHGRRGYRLTRHGGRIGLMRTKRPRRLRPEANRSVGSAHDGCRRYSTGQADGHA